MDDRSIDYVSLGKNIRTRRIKNHLTQEQLAEKCFLSSGYIGDIEHADRIPSIQALFSISCALNTTPDALLLDTLVKQLSSDILDTPVTLREPDRTLRNTLSNWYLCDLPDESMTGEPPVTKEQLLRLDFRLLGDPAPTFCAESI